MEHSEECIRKTAEADAAIVAYDTKWPHTCKACGGTGIVSWEENQAPLNSGERWMETFVESCDLCVGLGICPRCGGFVNEWYGMEHPEEQACPRCGWNWGNGTDDVRPVPYECQCWEEQEWEIVRVRPDPEWGCFIPFADDRE